MRVENLHLSRVRNLTDVNIHCCPGINVISGKNAAGKTAILEGIYLLSRASSFRTPRARDIIQHGQEKLSVTASVRHTDDTSVVTGIEKGHQQTLIKYNGDRVKKRSEQARNLPLITITTESHRLLYGSPKERRHWLDWSLFHVEQNYMHVWLGYHTALRQRNSLIRRRAGKAQFPPWEKQMAATAARIRAMRAQYLQHLQARLQRPGVNSFIDLTIDLSGNAESEEEILQKYSRRDSDMAAGHTQHGPHREDVRFCQSGLDLGKVYSRGEGKRFVLVLLLAQAREYQDRCQQAPLLLIDDLPAELDEEQRQAMLAMIEDHSLQAFLTTVHPEMLPVQKAPKRVFHVEQGQIIKVVE